MARPRLLGMRGCGRARAAAQHGRRVPRNAAPSPSRSYEPLRTAVIVAPPLFGSEAALADHLARDHGLSLDYRSNKEVAACLRRVPAQLRPAEPSRQMPDALLGVRGRRRGGGDARCDPVLSPLAARKAPHGRWCHHVERPNGHPAAAPPPFPVVRRPPSHRHFYPASGPRPRPARDGGRRPIRPRALRRAPARSRLAPRRVERRAMRGGGDHRASHPRAARGRPSSLRRRKLPRTSCTSLRPTSGLSLRPRSWLPPWMRPAALLIRPTPHGAGSPLPGRTRPHPAVAAAAAAAPGGGGAGKGPARACFPAAAAGLGGAASRTLSRAFAAVVKLLAVPAAAVAAPAPSEEAALLARLTAAHAAVLLENLAGSVHGKRLRAFLREEAAEATALGAAAPTPRAYEDVPTGPRVVRGGAPRAVRRAAVVVGGGCRAGPPLGNLGSPRLLLLSEYCT